MIAASTNDIMEKWIKTNTVKDDTTSHVIKIDNFRDRNAIEVT